MNLALTQLFLVASVGVLRATAFNLPTTSLLSTSSFLRSSPVLSKSPVNAVGIARIGRPMGLRGGFPPITMAAAFATSIKTEKLTPQTAGLPSNASSFRDSRFQSPC